MRRGGGGEEAAVTDAQLLPSYSKFLTVKTTRSNAVKQVGGNKMDDVLSSWLPRHRLVSVRCFVLAERRVGHLNAPRAEDGPPRLLTRARRPLTVDDGAQCVLTHKGHFTAL